MPELDGSLELLFDQGSRKTKKSFGKSYRLRFYHFVAPICMNGLTRMLATSLGIRPSKKWQRKWLQDLGNCFQDFHSR